MPPLPGPVHPERAEINGFCFRETDGFTDDQIGLMLSTQKVFFTRFQAIDSEGDEVTIHGNLIAGGWDEAEAEAVRRGLGEKVLGILCCGGT